MAYADPTYAPLQDHGNGMAVTLTGTSLSSSSKVLLDQIPRMGRVVRVASRKGSGTATSGQPRLTKDEAGLEVVVQLASLTYAAGVDQQFDPPATYYDASGLYYWPTPDAGSDNALADELHFLPGWGDR